MFPNDSFDCLGGRHMMKVGIAALAAVAMTGAFAGTANAGGPDLGAAPCADVNALFETANVQRDPLPEPLESTAGTAYRTVCGVTG
jgi:hypothetical protein